MATFHVFSRFYFKTFLFKKFDMLITIIYNSYLFFNVYFKLFALKLKDKPKWITNHRTERVENLFFTNTHRHNSRFTLPLAALNSNPTFKNVIRDLKNSICRRRFFSSSYAFSGHKLNVSIHENFWNYIYRTPLISYCISYCTRTISMWFLDTTSANN